MVTASNLVFTGVMTGEFQALDAETGKLLWRWYTVPGNPADGSTIALHTGVAGVLRDHNYFAMSLGLPSDGNEVSELARLLDGRLVDGLVLTRTRFGSRLRAAVDDPRVAQGLGINVSQVFLLTFAVGSGLAGLGGALGAPRNRRSARHRPRAGRRA